MTQPRHRLPTGSLWPYRSKSWLRHREIEISVLGVTARFGGDGATTISRGRPTSVGSSHVSRTAWAIHNSGEA